MLYSRSLGVMLMEEDGRMRIEVRTTSVIVVENGSI